MSTFIYLWAVYVFPRIGLSILPIWLQRNRWTDPRNMQIAHRHMNVWMCNSAQFLFWEHNIEFPLQCGLTIEKPGQDKNLFYRPDKAAQFGFLGTHNSNLVCSARLLFRLRRFQPWLSKSCGARRCPFPTTSLWASSRYLAPCLPWIPGNSPTFFLLRHMDPGAPTVLQKPKINKYLIKWICIAYDRDTGEVRHIIWSIEYTSGTN